MLKYAGHMLDGILVSAQEPIIDNAKVCHLQLIFLSLFQVCSLGTVCVMWFTFNGVIGILPPWLFLKFIFLQGSISFQTCIRHSFRGGRYE